MYKYTKKATEVIKEAEKLALELGHNYIGTEHLLYGLCAVSDGVSAKVLTNSGLTSKKIKDAIIDIIGIGKTGLPITGFTPKVKRVIESAYMEARSEGIGYIGTEHILLAILKEGESVATRIMIVLNVDTTAVLAEIDKMYCPSRFVEAPTT